MNKKNDKLSNLRYLSKSDNRRSKWGGVRYVPETGDYSVRIYHKSFPKKYKFIGSWPSKAAALAGKKAWLTENLPGVLQRWRNLQRCQTWSFLEVSGYTIRTRKRFSTVTPEHFTFALNKQYPLTQTSEISMQPLETVFPLFRVGSVLCRLFPIKTNHTLMVCLKVRPHRD